ncbi:hypothetical protein W97_02751 [Coniosporium apollinis CBS 100218]|uniref:Uncharacterized protein n=1 Tax=Coniosporium apollinis (strain CBS 100218) TaxID=1168221 RepID=R7YNT6_CONA1|nr:uncharacterized protein W97_02751 [Coniosporium apollinis CBS 100218]EON63523.1 hypothetical protein W97_02751 [Coniosporium apollinis CBS 100218]
MSASTRGYEPFRSKNASQPGEEPCPAICEIQGHLPSRTFASANKSRRTRACQQVTVGVFLSLLMLWPLFVYGLPVAFFAQSLGGYYMTVNRFCSQRQGEFSFFEPDTVMGNFTLGQAKAIDLAWNTVLGRGGQAVMTYTSYNAVANALTRIAETTPVKYELFAGLAFYPTGVFTLAHLVKGLHSLRGWRPKFAMAWLLFSSVLILAMPSLIDASSGYIQPPSLFYVSGVPGDNHGPLYRASEQVPRALLSVNASEAPYTCMADGVYQWGFASGWFLILMTLMPVWVFGTYCIWMDTQHNSELTRKGRTMGPWRAVVDLAEAMALELGPHTNGYSDAQLAKILENRPPIKYDAQVDEKGLSHIGLAPRLSARLKLSFEAMYG